MWILIIVISFLYTLSDANVCNNTKCEKPCERLHWSSFENCENVILNNNSIMTIQSSSMYTQLKKLDLSHNRLEHLPEEFLFNAIALKEVNLGNNMLKHLPEHFLTNSSKLRVLQLEGNQLTKIPASVFHPSLLNLSVDCTCDLAISIKQHLNNSNGNSELYVTCTKSSFASSFEKVDDFFEKNCGSQSFLALYIALPIVALCLIIGVVTLYLWKKNCNTANFESKTATEKSPSHGQPRYMTRSMDVIASTTNQGSRQDYENVFVGDFQTNMAKPHGYSKEQSRPGELSKQIVEEDIYLESDANEGDQPIYSNTQGVYYNYCGQGSNVSLNKEDDVYILPDH